METKLFPVLVDMRFLGVRVDQDKAAIEKQRMVEIKNPKFKLFKYKYESIIKKSNKKKTAIFLAILSPTNIGIV